MLTSSDNFNRFNQHSFSLTIPKLPSVTDYAQSTAIPGLTLGEALTGTPFVDRKEPGDKIIFSVLSITCVADEELKLWKECFDWISSLGFPESYSQYGRLSQGNTIVSGEDAFCDGILTIYNNQQSPILRINIRDMFPIAVSEINLATNDSGDESTSFVIDLQYRSYEVDIIT